MTRPVLVYFSDVWLLEVVKHATENKDIGSWDISLKWRKWTKHSMNITYVHRCVCGRYPPGRHPLRPVPPDWHPWADTPLKETVTEAGGTHPTGMHSCFSYTYAVFLASVNLMPKFTSYSNPGTSCHLCCEAVQNILWTFSRNRSLFHGGQFFLPHTLLGALKIPTGPWIVL